MLGSSFKIIAAPLPISYHLIGAIVISVKKKNYGNHYEPGKKKSPRIPLDFSIDSSLGLPIDLSVSLSIALPIGFLIMII